MSFFNMKGASDKAGSTDFRAIQAMQKRQEEKTAKEKEIETSLLNKDVVSISDVARSRITSSIGQVGGNKNSGTASAPAGFNATTIGAESSGGSKGSGDAEAIESSLSGVAEEDEDEQTPLEAQIEALEEKIEEKEAELEELMGDNSEEALTKAGLLQAEIGLLRIALGELHGLQAEAEMAEATSKVEQAPGRNLASEKKQD